MTFFFQLFAAFAIPAATIGLSFPAPQLNKSLVDGVHFCNGTSTELPRSVVVQESIRSIEPCLYEGKKGFFIKGALLLVRFHR